MKDLTHGAGNGLVYDYVEEYEQVTLPNVAANDQHVVENAYQSQEMLMRL